jgi:polyhydroxyalkanoate synthesis repressor PhaR
VAKSDAKEGAPVTIKKYANRRLYNTAKSSYVTLDHLSQMVRDDIDFVVVDAKTGEDITRSVLAQIIFEEEAKGQNMLPQNFLRQLIRLYGDALQGVVPGYLEASMETFSRNQEQMREQMSRIMGANPAMANFEALARSNMEWFDNAMRMFTPFAGGTSGEAHTEKKPSKPEPSSSDIDDLKQQLDAMREQISKLAKD